MDNLIIGMIESQVTLILQIKTDFFTPPID